MSRPETGKMRFGDEVGLFIREYDAIRLKDRVNSIMNGYVFVYQGGLGAKQTQVMEELFALLTEIEQQGAKEQTMKPFDECKKEEGKWN